MTGGTYRTEGETGKSNRASSANKESRAKLSNVVSTNDNESKKDEAWANLCVAEGWVCRACGSAPERGQRFTKNICDDCRKIVRNE